MGKRPAFPPIGSAMPRVNLHIPLGLTRQKAFFDPGQQQPALFGFPAKLRSEAGYFYLELANVPQARAESVLERARRCLKWASVRLDIGILTDRDPLKYSNAEVFDGQFATAFPVGAIPRPIRMAGHHTSQEPSTRLFAALQEAATRKNFLRGGKGSLALACELFELSEFEATANAQFLMLTSVLEVLAKPKKRNTRCIRLVDELLKVAKAAQQLAAKQGRDDVEEAFKSLRDSAIHLKKESITGSVRQIAIATSKALGDAEPKTAGKRAATLYGKRSKLAHEGKQVTWGDVGELRQLVREVIAVEAGCFDRIRDRYP
jgi:hypothetical protein